MNKTQNGNKRNKATWVVTLSFLALGLAGIITTAIVDFALNRDFTWSLFPIGAILFSWLCIWPLLVFEKRSPDIALCATSIFAFPFLNVLCRLTGGDWYVSIAVPLSICGVIIIWLVRLIFAAKLSIWNKLAISTMVLAAGNIVITVLLGRILHNGGFDTWNLLSVAILIAAAAALSITGYTRKKKRGGGTN